MQPLKEIVGNARVVSLGEATHGTREFFQLKHRMLEFLATEMGFTMYSIEANMREFNASGKGRVEFTGFDMQTPTVAR
jgi:erythromycin esterase